MTTPPLLLLARTARGLSQTGLAEKMGTSQTKISEFEAGRRPLVGDYLEKAAAVLDMPVDFFAQMPPQHATDTSPFHHRKLQSVGATKIRQVHARLRIMQMQIENLLVSAEGGRAFDGIKPFDPEEYRGGVEEVAQTARLSWDAPSGPIPNMVELVEGLGGLVILCDFGAVRIDGLSRFVPGMPPMIFLNQRMPGDRQRWTLAHELAHLLMHVDRTPHPDLEMQANEFTSEFLLPLREVKRDMAMGVDLHQLAALKRKWGVSIQALIMRAKSIGLIDEKRKRTLFIQLSKRGWRTREPVHIDPEQPGFLRRIIEDLRDTGLTLDQLAAQAKCSHREFVSTYYPDRRGLRLVN